MNITNTNNHNNPELDKAVNNFFKRSKEASELLKSKMQNKPTTTLNKSTFRVNKTNTTTSDLFNKLRERINKIEKTNSDTDNTAE